MDNPYLATAVDAVENEHLDITEILDAATGVRRLAGATNTVITVDASGGRHVVQQHVRIRGGDGRLLNAAEQIYRCACGCDTDLLSQHSVRFCEFCQATIHVAHLKTWDDGATTAVVCPTCWTPGRRARLIKRVLRWLLNVR